MKKIIFLLTLTGLLFCGCSKHDRDGETPDQLAGTTWKYTQKLLDDDGDEFNYSGTISFAASASMSVRYTLIYKDSRYSYLNKDETETGTYSYDKPKVTATIDGETEALTVSGNKMTTEPDDENGDYIVFTKQSTK